MDWLCSTSRRKRFRISIRGLFLVVGLAAAFVTSILFEEKLYRWALIPACIVLIASLVEFVFGDIITERRYPARTETILQKYADRLLNVYGQLMKQLESAIQSLSGCDKNQVNATIHLLVQLESPSDEYPEHAFVQITDYQGGLGGQRWRFVDSSKGIIGRCCRTKQSESVSFASEEEYRHRMVRDFGFTKEEMIGKTMTARSYLAHPLLDEDVFVGALFLFSTEPQVFPRAADASTLADIATACVGLLKAADIL